MILQIVYFVSTKILIEKTKSTLQDLANKQCKYILLFWDVQSPAEIIL